MIYFIDDADYEKIIRAVYTDRDDLYDKSISISAAIEKNVKNALSESNGCQVFKIENSSVFVGFVIFHPDTLKQTIVMRKQSVRTIEYVRSEFNSLIKIL